MRTGRLLAALALCAALGSAACGGRPDPVPAPETSTRSSPAAVASAPTPPVRTQPWFDLQVGDCVDRIPAVAEGDVDATLVDCSAPHRAEAYHRAPVPVDAAVTDIANQRCSEALAAYTGRPDGYAVSYLIDSNQDRTADNPLPSTVICLLQDPAGAPLTGSAHSR